MGPEVVRLTYTMEEDRRSDHLEGRHQTAFDRMGDGPPVVLVCGGSVTRMADVPIAQELAKDFTVLNYDRRGRGDSGDTLPYAIDREVEDIAAVVEAAGGSANLWGSSSGAVLALRAAATYLPIDRLALWEPPFIPEDVLARPRTRWSSTSGWSRRTAAVTPSSSS